MVVAASALQPDAQENLGRCLGEFWRGLIDVIKGDRPRGVEIPLRGQQDYILGRAEATQAILPDIDLNRYGAHEKGVSRLHCHLRYEGDSLMVVDLGSANGTFLNGTRLTPERPMPLSENDTISLGSLKVQVFRKV